MSQFKPGTASQAFPERRPMPTREVRRPSASLLPPSPAVPDEEDVEDSGLTSAQKIALGLTLIFIFLRFSFLHELLMARIGFDSHLLLVFGGSAILAALLSGGLLSAFTSRIAIAWLGFTVCLVLATLASTWRGGSFAVLYPFLRATLILVFLIPAAATSTKSIALGLKTIGLAGLVTILLGLTVNNYQSGRLELSGAGGSIQNSNDYAALLILVMPAIAFLTMRRGSSFVFKGVGLAALGLCCFLVLSTGSRGALISMAISAIYMIKVGSGKIRLALLLGLPLVALAVIPFLPAEASARLASLFSSKQQTEEAVASQMQRTALLTESLRFTAQHPLLGVGPGTFEVYEAQAAETRGQRGMWHETHNSYTQVSSECGIPAVLFYLAAIFMSFMVFNRARKSANPEIRSLASILNLMLVSFCVCMFFLSQAYGFGFPVLGGFAISLNRLLKREQATADLAEPLAA